MAVHHAVKARSRGNLLSRVYNICAYHRLRVAFQLFCVVYLIFAGFILLVHNPKRNNIGALTHSARAHAHNLNPNTKTKSNSRYSVAKAQNNEVEDNNSAAVNETIQQPAAVVPRESTVRPPRKKSTRSTQVNTSPLVLGFSVHGGVGNQIYDMLEALYLVRHVNAVMLVPSVLPRTDIEGESIVRSGSRVWDLARLRMGTRGKPVYPYLPPRCRRRIHMLYLFIRRNARAPTAGTIPTEVRHSACALARAAPGAPRKLDCDSLFASTIVRVRRQNLTLGGDDTYIRELRNVRGCVWISGHTYDRAGADGDEYLYAHMHFLDTHARIAKVARKWPLDKLAVVHVRYDEELCDPELHNGTHICVRVHKDGHYNPVPPVYWPPVSDYASGIASVVLRNGATSIYIAASPYVPVETVMALRKEFGRHLKVERMGSLVFDDEADLNFLERELAIRARVFVGDFGSTWSGTVYFKRRTLGTNTLWTNVVLGKTMNLGYYSHNTPLEVPN